MAVERTNGAAQEAVSPRHTGGAGFKPVPAVERAIRLLRELAVIEGEASLGELSGRINAPRSTTHSILSTLEAAGLVTKHPQHKTYRLGVGVLELGGAYSAQTSLLRAFNVVARTMVEQCGETVKLAVLDEREVIYIGKQEGTSPVRMVARVGGRLPAHPTAVGKVLLAGMPAEALEALYHNIDMVALTPNTTSSLEALREQLAQIRVQGYAIEREETAHGLQCVAAPVRDQQGLAVAGLSIGIASSTLDPQRLDLVLDVVRNGARAMSRMLGWNSQEQGG
jgi:DNA-binding IclR family transcriptional regulator